MDKLNSILRAAIEPETRPTGVGALIAAPQPASATAHDFSPRFGVLVRTNGDASRIAATGASMGTVAGDIVTAYATHDQIVSISSLPSVVEISASPPRELVGDIPIETGDGPGRSLDVSTLTTGVNLWHKLGYDGSGVIIGFVDTGLDVQHLDVRTGPSGELQSRVLRIWDQLDHDGASPGSFAYGTEWTKADIEADLLDVLCPPDCSMRHEDSSGHGTHVTTIAAGDGSTSQGQYTGMAPGAHIIHVKSALSDSGIIDGAAYIFQVADELGMPAVVNLSIGSQGGPHDGTSLLDTALTNLLGAPGRAIITAAGNDGDQPVHAGAEIAAGDSADITFQVPETGFVSGTGSDLLNGWYDGESDLCLTVVSPNDTSAGPVCLSEPSILEETPDGCVLISNEGPRANGDNEVLLRVNGTSSGCVNNVTQGTWTISIAAADGSPGGRFDVWAIGGETLFDPPFGGTGRTIAEPGTAPGLITVGSYTTKACWQASGGDYCNDPLPQVGEISRFSSRGPTRSGVTKPDIAAPGERIFAALSRDAFAPSATLIPPGGNYLGLEGTSMAAPHVSGAAALVFQIHPEWTQEDLRSALVAAAAADPFTSSGSENTWGAGKLRMPLPPIIKGDVNCDNAVEPIDGLFVLVHVSGGPPSLDCLPIGSIAGGTAQTQPVFGDVDCDLDIDAIDALFILRHVAALPVDLADACSEIGTHPSPVEPTPTPSVSPTPVATGEPTATPTPEPSAEPTPTVTPPPTGTAEPEPTSTPTPPP